MRDATSETSVAPDYNTLCVAAQAERLVFIRLLPSSGGAATISFPSEEIAMVCGLHIFLIVAGIYALVAGKLPLSQNKVAVGWPVRVAGVIFLLPLPVLMLIGFAIGFSSGLNNQPDPLAGREGTWLAVEIALQLICLGGGLGLCFITAGPPENVRPYRRRRRDYDEDDYD